MRLRKAWHIQLKDKIYQSKPVQGLLQWTKTHSLPGFKRLPIFDVLKFVWQEMNKENINIRANSAAYSFFLALFPFLLFLLTLVAYFKSDQFQVYLASFHKSIAPFLPETAERFLFEDIIYGIFELHRSDLLSLGLILTLYFASDGMLAMIKGFEKEYHHTFLQRSWWEDRLVALILTGFMGVLFMGSLILTGLGGNTVFRWLTEMDISYPEWMVDVLRWCSVVLFCYVMVSVIYRYGPAFVTRKPYIYPGTTLAVILILLTSWGFSLFLNQFGSYNKIYGGIGAVIVMMIWIRLNVFILLMGFELNTSIAVNRTLRKLKKESENSPDQNQLS